LSGKGLVDAERRRFNRLALAPSLIVLFMIAGLPAIYLVVTSLTPFQLVNPGSSTDFSSPLRNYRLLPGDPRFVNSLWVQAKLSFWGVLLQVLLGMLLALLLHTQSRVVEFARTFFLIPMVLPPIVVAILFKVLYTPDISPVHWALAAVGWPAPALITHPDLALLAIVIADVWEWLPFTLLMVLAALQMMPVDPVEAARIDGAGGFQVTRHIVLPYLRPTLLVAGLFRLIDSIKAFPLIYVLTDGGPGTVTEVTNYYAFRQAFNFSFLGFASAITVVMMAAVFALSWWLVRLVGLGVEHE
jgi:multiple sugar transport system permease protein